MANDFRQQGAIDTPAAALAALDTACACIISNPELFPQVLGYAGWGILERAGFVAMRLINTVQTGLVDVTRTLTGQASATNWAQDDNARQYLQADGDFLFISEKLRVWLAQPAGAIPPEDVIIDLGSVAAQFQMTHTPSGGQPYIIRPLGQVRTIGWAEGGAQAAPVAFGTARLAVDSQVDWWQYPIPRRFNPKNDAAWTYTVPGTSVANYQVIVEMEGVGVNVNALDPAMATEGRLALRNALKQVMLEKYGPLGMAAILQQIGRLSKNAPAR